MRTKKILIGLGCWTLTNSIIYKCSKAARIHPPFQINEDDFFPFYFPLKITHYGDEEYFVYVGGVWVVFTLFLVIRYKIFEFKFK